MMLAAEFVSSPAPRRARPTSPLRGLPAETHSVFAALQAADGATLRGLARRARLTPHRVADALNALVAVGLAERDAGSVWLTPAARR